MKTYLLFSSLFFALISSFAQMGPYATTFTTEGKPYSYANANHKRFFANDSGQVIAVKIDKNKVILELYSTALMKQISKKKYSDFQKDAKYQKILEWNGRLFYLYSEFDEKNKKEQVKVREINKNTGLFFEAISLFETSREVAVIRNEEPDAKDFKKIVDLGQNIRFEVHTSKDGKKLMIRYKLNPVKRNNKENFDELGFFVFDEQWKKIWGREFKMHLTEDQMDNWAYNITNQGKVISLHLIKKPMELLAKFYENDQETKNVTIQLKDTLKLQEIFLDELNSGAHRITAYYFNGVEFKITGVGTGYATINSNGLFHMVFDDSGKVLTLEKHEFPVDLIKSFESDFAQKKATRRENKNKAGINDLVLKEQVKLNDGGRLIIGEQHSVQNEREFFGLSNSVSTFYHYENIIICKLDSADNLVWMKKLPKKQKGKYGKGSMGYKMWLNDNKALFFFVERKRNLKKPQGTPLRFYGDGQKGYLCVYFLDPETGNFVRKIVLNKGKLNGKRTFKFGVEGLVKCSKNDYLAEFYMKYKKNNMYYFKVK